MTSPMDIPPIDEGGYISCPSCLNPLMLRQHQQLHVCDVLEGHLTGSLGSCECGVKIDVAKLLEFIRKKDT